jgi:hypothetical protein
MPDETAGQNAIGSGVKDRSTRRGDVPEALMRRYYTDGRGGDGLGFYADARVQTAAFRDRGRELVALRADPNAIRDMLAIAQHRGWSIVTVRGSADFRREAWIAGRSMGLEVQGYRATERDLQDLQRRLDRREDRREVRAERREDRRDRTNDERTARRKRREDTAAERQLRVVGAVVRARVEDPERRAQIMEAARNRIANWLERGARFEPSHADRFSAPDRQRAR